MSSLFSSLYFLILCMYVYVYICLCFCVFIIGDKTRMDQLSKSDDCYVRASPTRGVLGGIAEHTADVITLCEAGAVHHWRINLCFLFISIFFSMTLMNFMLCSLCKHMLQTSSQTYSHVFLHRTPQCIHIIYLAQCYTCLHSMNFNYLCIGILSTHSKNQY